MGTGTKRGIVETVTDAARAASVAVGDAAAKLVGGDDVARVGGAAARAESHRAEVAAEDAKDDYERAKLNMVRSFGAMPQTGPYQLRFAISLGADENGEALGAFIDGSTEVAREDLKAEVPDRDGQCTYSKPTNFAPDPDSPSVTVTEAWLIAPSGEAVRSYVGGQGLTIGGGRCAQIPAGHLLF